MTTILVNGYFERTQELSMTDQFFDEPRQHSKIKAQIVAKYFPAWAKIMAARLRPRQPGDDDGRGMAKPD